MHELTGFSDIQPYVWGGPSLTVLVILFSLIILAMIWSLVIKGFALWHAARNTQKGWFIAMLILNTVGILEIVYLIWFRNKKTGMPSHHSSSRTDA